MSTSRTWLVYPHRCSHIPAATVVRRHMCASGPCWSAILHR